MGLMISNLLAQQFDGDIHCESEYGVGSKFIVRLRLQKKETEEIKINKINVVRTKSRFKFEWNNENAEGSRYV